MMLLAKKNAIVYGSGSVGSAIAHAFAREGARIFLASRNEASLAAVARAIAAEGGSVETAQFDVLDEQAVEQHAAAVQRAGGSIDVSINTTRFVLPGTVGLPGMQMTVENFVSPIENYMRAHFLTTRAAALRMVDQHSGVILTLTASPGRVPTANFGGVAVAWASIEALTRGLAAELGPDGIRAICIRANAIPESDVISTSYAARAQASGKTVAEVQRQAEMATLLHRLPTLADVANMATFLASDQTKAMTAAVVNLTCGAFAD